MNTNKTNIPIDFIIHLGISIKEKLNDSNMELEELAERTGFLQEYINKVINGQKDISHEFSKKLEYIFKIKSTFWLNLQKIYTKEITTYINS